MCFCSPTGCPRLRAPPRPPAMDQDYERRLLRQIIIQNENTVPCVSDRSCPIKSLEPSPVDPGAVHSGAEHGLGDLRATCHPH